MGNRAIITTEKNYKNNGIGIYVHWCGDKESVQKWLNICKAKRYRKPEEDDYGWAYLVREIANYFGDGLSVGVNVISQLASADDNGIWIIKDWKIVDHKE